MPAKKPLGFEVELNAATYRTQVDVRDSSGYVEHLLEAPSSATYSTNTDGLIKLGTLSSPISTSAAGYYGIKAFVTSTATSGTCTVARFRAIGSGAAGSARGVLAQASSLAGVSNGSLVGLRAEAINKAGSTVTDQHTAIQAKVEDARATDGSSTASVYSGQVNILRLEGQISANPTSGYYGIRFDFQTAGASTAQNADAMLLLISGGQNKTTVAFLETGNTLANWGSTSTVMISSGTLSDSDAADIKCDARMLVNIGGTNHWLPLYNTAA